MMMMLLITSEKTGSVICAVYLPRHAKIAIADRQIYIIKRDIHAGRVQHQTLDRFAPSHCRECVGLPLNPNTGLRVAQCEDPTTAAMSDSVRPILRSVALNTESITKDTIP